MFVLCYFQAYLAAADGNGNGGTPTMARRSSIGSYQSTNSDTPSTPASQTGQYWQSSIVVSECLFLLVQSNLTVQAVEAFRDSFSWIGQTLGNQKVSQ